MIIDLPRFLDAERPLWVELEKMLDAMEIDGSRQMDLQQTQRFNYLYQRVLSDLGRIVTFSSEPETRRYLESLTARAYAEMNESRDKSLRFTMFKWLFSDFPRVFRKYISYFWLSLAVFAAGSLFGAGILAVDPGSRYVLEPFGHAYMTPTQRVKDEESGNSDRFSGEHASFSTALMYNNIHVTFYTFVAGITYGIGTLILLFYNGIGLGAIALDYVNEGQTVFLLGWLLPHGVIEIPASLIAGQAGLLLGRTLMGRGDRHPLRVRFRLVRAELALLVYGSAMMLVWAGIIESFLSQYHKPVLPYSLKITFGLFELVLLVAFLAMAGRRAKPDSTP
ncbi:MAG TPA: stage II sporulation protein M [Chthoniobacteraceae bacterium]|nr:stage II sporulation protein M [Chthoniobacteraceae bacterium]